MYAKEAAILEARQGTNKSRTGSLREGKKQCIVTSMSAKIKPTLYIIRNLTRQGFGDMWELAILFIRITKRILKMLALLKS